MNPNMGDELTFIFSAEPGQSMDNSLRYLIKNALFQQPFFRKPSEYPATPAPRI
jgi:hypothetical protein